MMNRIPSGAIGAVALTVLCAGAYAQQGSVEIYGQVGIGVTTRTGVSTVAKTDMSDNQISASYLGFRGTEDIGGGLRALYRLEMSVALDTGLTGATVAGAAKAFNRQSYVGLDLPSAGTVTLGRQFHAGVQRVIISLDPLNAAGTLSVIPIGLFGVNRFVGNDTRADNSIKYRVGGSEGFQGGVSYGFSEDVSGTSYSADIAQVTPNYQIAAWMVNYSAPTVVATTGFRPEHQVWGFGGQAPIGPVKLYANYLGSKLDSTVAGRGTQENKITTLGVGWNPSVFMYKLIYTYDQGSTLNGIAGRDGTKTTMVAAVEYLLSKRSSLYAALFENRFADGYKLEAVNLAALGRDPASDAVRGLSVGMRHSF